jgi:ABC-type Fe3+/spermidine/putrescine transport system ATPase subunit
MKDLVVRNLKYQRESFDCQFDFELAAGQWLGVSGKSGAGKTTLLELISGFEKPSSGEIFLNQMNISGLDVEARKIAYLFQGNSLFPKLTIAQNLSLSLQTPEIQKSKHSQFIGDYLAAVGLSGKENRYPGELSGGEQARAGLARALLRPSKLLLLDEPFSSLDSELRIEMHLLVKKLQAMHGFMVICISHQVEDNLLFSDLMLILNHGKVEELGVPNSVCTAPQSLTTARLLGYGIIMADEVGKYFVRFDQLTPSKLTSQSFLKCTELIVPHHKIAPSPRGRALLCLDTGTVYPLDPRESFSGIFYFDKSKVTRFS